MRRYGIYAPVLGEREDYPVILLRNAVTKDNTAVQIWNGEIRKTKMRSPEFMKVQHVISSLDTSANAIHVSGDVTSHYPNGSNIVVYNQTDSTYEEHTLSTTSIYNGTSTVITVTGDITASTPSEYVFNAEDVGSNDPSNVDFRKVKFPDSNPALRYEHFNLSDETERVVGFTSSHIYYWDSTLTKWQLIFTCSSSCTYWDATKYGDNIAATNNIDRPIYWDGNTANTFENLDTQLTATTSNYIAKAKFIRSYRNYLFLANVTLQDSTVYHHYHYWSNIGEGVIAGGFRQDTNKDAGSAYVSGNGEITGGYGDWQGYLVVFKRYSHRKFWFVGGDIPFEQDELSPDVGCSSPGSIVNDPDGNLYFYGSDKNFREISAGKISYGIDNTARNINPSLLEKIRSTFINEYSELRWSIPYGNESTANNKIVIYKEGKWNSDLDIAVTAFGKYTRQNLLKWDTLPFTEWDKFGWDSWDTVDASSDFPIDLCSDGSGYTYDLHGGYTDDGSEYDSYFVITTDLADKTALPYYKRIHQIYVYCRSKSTGSLTLSVKRDNETYFQSLGSISMVGDEEILRVRLSVDIRARHFLIKVLGVDDYSFIGLEFEYELAGER